MALALIGSLGNGTAAWALDVGFGPRLGLTRGQNGFELGGQLVLADFGIDLVAPLRFEASASYGAGETEDSVGFDALHLNANFEYVLLNPTRVLQFYPLVGLSAYRRKLDGCEAQEAGCGSMKLGLNLGGGILYRRVSVDATLGVGQVPTFTITAAFTIGL